MVPPLHKERKGLVCTITRIVQLECIINIRALKPIVFLFACFTLYGDELTTANDLHAVCSVYTCLPGEHGCGLHLHIMVVLQPQNLHTHVPQDFQGNNNSSNGVIPDPSFIM